MRNEYIKLVEGLNSEENQAAEMLRGHADEMGVESEELEGWIEQYKTIKDASEFIKQRLQNEK